MFNKKPAGEVIKVQPKFIVLIIILITSIFGLFIYLSAKQARNYVAADFRTAIKPTVVNGKSEFGSLRGALFYEENNFIDKAAPLIGNNPVDNKLWESHGPAIDLNNERHQYTLGNLKLPFAISKEASSDTLVVKKDNITFKFKLDARESSVQ